MQHLVASFIDGVTAFPQQGPPAMWHLSGLGIVPSNQETVVPSEVPQRSPFGFVQLVHVDWLGPALSAFRMKDMFEGVQFAP